MSTTFAEANVQRKMVKDKKRLQEVRKDVFQAVKSQSEWFYVSSSVTHPSACKFGL